MNKKQKIILIFIMITIITIISIMLIIKNMSTKQNNQVNIYQEQEENLLIENNTEESDIYYDSEWSKEGNIDNTIKYVNNNSIYYTVKALTDKYIKLIGYGDKTNLKSMLSPSYITQYKITDNNILKIADIPKITDEKQLYRTIILNMTEAQVDNNIYIYILNGKGRIEGKEEKFTFNLMLEIDTYEKKYNIYPYEYIKDNNYDKLKIGDSINFKVEEITDRKSNNFVYIENKTEQEMANEYFYNYLELMLYYKDEAYNKLDKEYSKKRFASKDEFYNYLNANKILLATMSIDKYRVESKDNHKNYVCSDKYNNIYIFREIDGIMNYTAFLDNYTVPLDKEDYDKKSEFEKAKYNLSKFIKMVNTKDYNNIYAVLDETFKQNNFKTLTELKKYIQTNFYEMNDVKIEEYNDSNEYYVFTCKITNKRNTDESKNVTLVINIKEGTDFTMSFSVQ